MPEHYPLPIQRPKLRLVRENDPEFGLTQTDWEERIFQNVSHFSIVKFGVPEGSVCFTTDSFPKALAAAHGDKRILIYVVNPEGRAFCMSHKDYAKFATLWLQRKPRK